MPMDAWTPCPELSPAPEHSDAHLRAQDCIEFSLAELDPRQVIKGVEVAEGIVAEDVIPVGQMRENCPHCDTPLQLVLRTNNVIRSHLFCEQCTRCFDAMNPDGSSALLFAPGPVVY